MTVSGKVCKFSKKFDEKKIYVQIGIILKTYKKMFINWEKKKFVFNKMIHVQNSKICPNWNKICSK